MKLERNTSHNQYYAKMMSETLIIFVFLFLIYYCTAKGIKINNYRVVFQQMLIPFFGIWLLQFITKINCFSFFWWPSYFIGLAWSVMIPILQNFSNASIIHYDPRRDIIWGCYLMLFFMSFQGNLMSLKRTGSSLFSRCEAVLFTILFFLAIIIPIMELGHFMIYHVTITDESILALQDTYPKEMLGYVQTFLGPVKTIGVLMAMILIVGIVYHFCLKIPVTINKSPILMLLLLITTVIIVSKRDTSSFFDGWQRVAEYQYEQSLFIKNYDERYSSLQLLTENTLAQTNQGTVIIVIGESACRDNMHIYNSEFPYDDTSWLESKHADKNFIIYNHVYSSYPMTVESLMRACTEMSQYNDKEFNSSITMVDIAKKAGYKTYWFSNQGGMGASDAPVTFIMKTADHYESPIISDRLHYDEDLLPLLKEVDPGKNNFVVIHLKGSHNPYIARYPKEDEVFDSSNTEGQYANTILYTDKVLKEIFDYATKNLNLQVMVYFSDHGEDLKLMHGPALKNFDQVRIPMFIYLSKSYQENHPNKTELLRYRKYEYFSNDMIYNTVSGILNAPSNHYDAKEDLSSENYGFGVDNIWTFKHSIPITDDPDVMR